MPLYRPMPAEAYVRGMRRPETGDEGKVPVVDSAGTNLTYLAISGLEAAAPSAAPVGWLYYATDLPGMLVRGVDEWEPLS